MTDLDRDRIIVPRIIRIRHLRKRNTLDRLPLKADNQVTAGTHLRFIYKRQSQIIKIISVQIKQMSTEQNNLEASENNNGEESR